MVEITLTIEKTVKEEKVLNVPEKCFRKSAIEIFMIEVIDGKPKIKGIYFGKKDKMMDLELYQEKKVEEILNYQEATEEEWNAQLQKCQEFLKNY